MDLWPALGWLGNGFYFSRFLQQWLASERSRRSVTPAAFWWLSLGGCVCLGTYVAVRGAPVLLPAYLINGAIYVRNVALLVGAGRRPRLGPLPTAGLGALAGALLLAAGVAAPRAGIDQPSAWLAAGIGGQVVWSTRFLLQWWSAERSGRADIPAAFWWYTLVGSGLNIAYTAYLGDAVLIASYALTPLYPIRNLVLERRHRKHGG